jgi:hypothetical protein
MHVLMINFFCRTYKSNEIYYKMIVKFCQYDFKKYIICICSDTFDYINQTHKI